MFDSLPMKEKWTSELRWASFWADPFHSVRLAFSETGSGCEAATDL